MDVVFSTNECACNVNRSINEPIHMENELLAKFQLYP